MAEPVVLYGDARAETITALRAALAPRVEPYAAGVPVDKAKPAGSAPVVVVPSADVVGGVARVTQNATVRVQVWHCTDADAHDLAQLARALLLASTGGDHLQRFDPLAGPIVTVDPDTEQPLAWFTVRAVMAGRAA